MADPLDFLNDPSQNPPSPPPLPLRKPAVVNKLPLLVGGGVVAMLLIVGILFAVFSGGGGGGGGGGPLAPMFEPPERSAVRQWLRDNTDSGKWEEVRWWDPRSATHSNLRADLKNLVRMIRLRYRTNNKAGAMELRDDVFWIENGSASLSPDQLTDLQRFDGLPIPEDVSPPPVPKVTQLVFDWPEADRDGAMLVIDELPYSVPTKGPVKEQLDSGSHTVVLRRPGYAKIELTVELTKGQERRVKPDWKRETGSGDARN